MANWLSLLVGMVVAWVDPTADKGGDQVAKVAAEQAPVCMFSIEDLKLAVVSIEAIKAVKDLVSIS
jgi:hypothetical protein